MVSTVRERDFSRNLGEEEGTVRLLVGWEGLWRGEVNTVEEGTAEDGGCF